MQLLKVCQADGGNASLQSTGDLIVNSRYISNVENDLYLRRTTNNDDRITIQASAHRFHVDAVERMSLTSSGATIKPALNIINANGDTMVGMKKEPISYSNSYRALQIGNTSGNYSIAFGYDPSGNSNSQFTGDGRELIFRNGAEFLTPNSSNDGWHNDVITLKDGTTFLDILPHGTILN